jgi:hypothetical protein
MFTDKNKELTTEDTEATEKFLSCSVFSVHSVVKYIRVNPWQN